MKNEKINYDELFTKVTFANNQNCSGANAIYKSIAEFQNNEETQMFLKNDGITLNRSKIRKYFRTLLGNAVTFKNGKYIVTSKENVLKFMKFCVNIYACFTKNNFSNFELYTTANLCKSNKNENLKYVEKQLEIIKEYIKTNF